MESRELKAGEILHSPADKADHLELVRKGSVEILSAEGQLTAGKGAILGLFESPGENYTFTYRATEDCRLELFPFENYSDADRIIRDNLAECDVLVTANADVALSLLGNYKRTLRRCNKQLKTIKDGYKTYRALCEKAGMEIQPWPLAEETEPFAPEEDLPDWIGDYYDQLGLMPAETKRAFYSTHYSLTTAAILEAAGHMQLICRLLEQLGAYDSDLRDRYLSSADLFDLYLNLHNRCSGIKGIPERIDAAVDEYQKLVSKAGLLPDDALERLRTRYTNGAAGSSPVRNDVDLNMPTADQATDPLLQEVTPAKTEVPDPVAAALNSLDKILAFTRIDPKEENIFRESIKRYTALRDKNSTSEEVRELRSIISRIFFDLYENAALKVLESSERPPVAVRLFLYFGFVDEDLAGRENTAFLLRLIEHIDADRFASMNVYTFFDWLGAVYSGTKDPSRNEYDQEYAGWLKSLKQTGEISPEEEHALLNTGKSRLHFELQNFMKTAMKICSGKPAVFCPVLSSHNFVRSPEQIFISAEMVDNNWKDIKGKDISLFFREALYHNVEFNIPRDSILIEVMPDMILLPMTGSRGGLWQETTGLRRDTAARMYLPIFTDEDLNLIQLRLAAQFRWQICKRVHGVHWNSPSYPTLTGEYCEYLSGFKKNSMLSTEAKEKLRSQIRTCRNSDENVFMLDYIQWVRFEAEGLPRLNRAARRILFTYCPFSLKARRNLISNPIYSEMIRRMEAQAAKTVKTLKSRYARYKNSDGDLPATIKSLIAYYENLASSSFTQQAGEKPPS